MNLNILNKFFTAVNFYKEQNKIPRDYGTGHFLYHSEINMLEAIHAHPEAMLSSWLKSWI